MHVIWMCNNRNLNELHWAPQRSVSESRPWNITAKTLLLLDIRSVFGFDLPLSSLQLLLMPLSSLRQDGPPVGNSCSSVPKDQLTSIIGCKDKMWNTIFDHGRLLSGGRSHKKKKKTSLGLFFPSYLCSCLNIKWGRHESRFKSKGKWQWGWILCKTHPDILFCLFGHVSKGQKQLGSCGGGVR